MINLELDSEQEDKIVVKSLTKYYKSECNELTSKRDEALLTSIEAVLEAYMSTSEYRAWKMLVVDAFKSIERGLKEAIDYASTADPVEHPPHYNNAGIECIDAMEAMSEGADVTPHAAYLWQNAFKYLWRWCYKGKPLEDLRKCRWYLDRLISTQEESQ
jgi:hypothetical protein